MTYPTVSPHVVALSFQINEPEKAHIEDKRRIKGIPIATMYKMGLTAYCKAKNMKYAPAVLIIDIRMRNGVACKRVE